MSDNDFDVAVVGTSLVESIIAAALSKAGLRVLHIDQTAEYGGRDASLSAIDLHHLILSPPPYIRNISIPVPLPQEILRQSRQYAISLSPSIVPSVSPFINTLVNSNVARYVPFKLLDSVGMYSQDTDGTGKVKAVPGSKEDVFKNKELGLSQKRKLMKFLLNTSTYEESNLEEQQRNRPFLEYLKSRDIGLDKEIAEAITYALALSTSSEEPTSQVLPRLKKYIRSTGRHGNSPFLVGHFGGAGELAQGFCRACAVGGGTYILGRQYSFKDTRPSAPDSSISPAKSTAKTGSNGAESSNDYRFVFNIEGVDEELRSKHVVSTADNLPSELRPASTGLASSKHLARCISVLEGPVRFSEGKRASPRDGTGDAGHETSPEDTENNSRDTLESDEDTEVDTALLIFPPGSLPAAENVNDHPNVGVVTAFIAGPSSMACPDGKRVVYLYTELPNDQDPEKALSPYLLAIQTLYQDEPTNALMTMFYTQPLPSSNLYCDLPSTSQPPQSSALSSHDDNVVIIREPTYHIAEFGDEVAKESKLAFWEVIRRLDLDGRGLVQSQEEVNDAASNDIEQSEADAKVVNMWPPFQPDDSNDV